MKFPDNWTWKFGNHRRSFAIDNTVILMWTNYFLFLLLFTRCSDPFFVYQPESFLTIWLRGPYLLFAASRLSMPYRFRLSVPISKHAVQQTDLAFSVSSPSFCKVLMENNDHSGKYQLFIIPATSLVLISYYSFILYCFVFRIILVAVVFLFTYCSHFRFPQSHLLTQSIMSSNAEAMAAEFEQTGGPVRSVYWFYFLFFQRLRSMWAIEQIF